MVLNDQFHAPAVLLPENGVPVSIELQTGGRDKALAPAENRRTVSELLALKHKSDYANPATRNTLVRTGVYGIIATELTGRKNISGLK